MKARITTTSMSSAKIHAAAKPAIANPETGR
jgi:hypothetical protein